MSVAAMRQIIHTHDSGTRVASPARLDREPLECSYTPAQVLRALGAEPWPFALTGSWAGGGAIVGSDPLLLADPAADPFATLDALPAVLTPSRHPVAVGGGWFGWLGYRLGRRIEELPPGPPRPVPLPEHHLAYYDNVLRLDPDGRWWFESLVTPGRAEALARRLTELRAKLAAPPAPPHPYVAPEPLRLAAGGRAAHLAAVAECRERIVAGEIFQANICIRLEARWDGTIAELFERALADLAPPYGAAFQTPWGGIMSLSPELFLHRRGENVTTAPIKGTIERDADTVRARVALDALRNSAKDAAEHVMIVDLMRNDLGRVCAYGSIAAQPAPEIEAHPGLWHLVSRVRGRLRPQAGDSDLLRATFPPGSVTGAPKVQAMHVISELESTEREAYTGAIGYVSPQAGLELSVAIRTFELRAGRLWLGAGGGIVADSDPQRELEEALLKARPLVAAIGTHVDAA
jgi:para-aminobenzoate synthetase / 4-amino-4-deoxychorismate lyase